MTDSLARFLSFIFNPIILLVTIPFFLLYKLYNDFVAAVLWTGYSFLFLLGMTVFLAIAVQRKIFTDMDVSKREQRPLLFLVSFVAGVLYIIGLLVWNGPHLLIVISLGVMLGIVADSFINRRIKASIHVATVTALLFALALVYNGYYLLTLLLIPLVGWARVKIKRHTLPETVVGGLLGILISLCVYGLNVILF